MSLGTSSLPKPKGFLSGLIVLQFSVVYVVCFLFFVFVFALKLLPWFEKMLLFRLSFHFSPPAPKYWSSLGLCPPCSSEPAHAFWVISSTPKVAQILSFIHITLETSRLSIELSYFFPFHPWPVYSENATTISPVTQVRTVGSIYFPLSNQSPRCTSLSLYCRRLRQFKSPLPVLWPHSSPGHPFSHCGQSDLSKMSI